MGLTRNTASGVRVAMKERCDAVFESQEVHCAVRRPLPPVGVTEQTAAMQRAGAVECVSKSAPAEE